MFFNQANKKVRQPAGKAATTKARSLTRTLYSVPVWMHERAFVGEFELGGRSYKLSFAPSQAEIADNALRLRGRLIVNDRQKVRELCSEHGRDHRIRAFERAEQANPHHDAGSLRESGLNGLRRLSLGINP